jgi:hypothetical protein
MVCDDGLTNRIRMALAHIPDVAEKKMFGSTAFMVRGKLCISGHAVRIMCRIDPALHDSALEREGCRTVVMKGRECRGFVYVDADSIRTQDELRYWVDLALQYNEVIR